MHQQWLMKQRLIFVAFSLLYYSPLFSSEKPKETMGDASTLTHLLPRAPLEGNKTPPTRVMFMAFDTLEKDDGLITSAVIANLAQYATPMIVSASILRTIMTMKELVSRDRSKTWLKKMQEVARADINANSRAASYTAIDDIMFEGWTFFALNDFLFLCIPKKDLIFSQPGLKNQPTKLSEQELRLGLKIDHPPLRQMSYEQLTKHLKNLNFTKELLPEIVGTITGKKTPFLTRNDYKESDRLAEIPQWILFLYSHGSVDGIIGGIKPEEFQTLLQFFDKKLLTKLFLVNACYSRGINSEKIYGNLKKNASIFSFPIILAAGPDVPAYGNGIVLRFQGSHVSLQYEISFSTFAEKTTKDTPIFYDTFLNSVIITPKATDESIRSLIHNQPVIRPAYRDTFVPLYDVLHISDTMAATRTSVLSIQKLPKRLAANTINTIIITTPFVPFTIDSESIAKLSILSGLPGNAKHRLADMRTLADSRYHYLANIAKVFRANYRHTKEFWIENITTWSSEGVRDYANVLIIPKRDLNSHTTSMHVTYTVPEPNVDTAMYGKKRLETPGVKKLIVPESDKEPLRTEEVTGEELANYKRSLTRQGFFGQKLFNEIEERMRGTRTVHRIFEKKLLKEFAQNLTLIEQASRKK